MANYPVLNYSMRDVRKAGEALRRNIPFDSPEEQKEARRIFAIANSWRDSHAYPIRRIRAELSGQLQRTHLRSSGLTAARLKRMPSVRRKLAVQPRNLNQIQDLGGCRIIVPSIGDVNDLLECNIDNSRHEWFRDYDYISEPKLDGYRCFHRVYKYRPRNFDEEVFSGRRIEIQLRTRLQHSWATAVEAVGLFRSEDFKGGSGDPDWRRLFKLMSYELAAAEGCLDGDSALSRADRIKEIQDIDCRIHAANILEHLSQAFNYTEMYIYDKAEYFLIEYDNHSEKVCVKPYRTSLSGVESLDHVEAEMRHGSRLNAVLVEADKIESLKEAYPNYFGDVQVFKANLKRITKGREAVEYTLPPQYTAPPPPKEVPDTSWFRRPRFRKPKGS